MGLHFGLELGEVGFVIVVGHLSGPECLHYLCGVVVPGERVRVRVRLRDLGKQVQVHALGLEQVGRDVDSRLAGRHHLLDSA